MCLNSKIKSSSFVDLWFVLSDKDLDSSCYGSQSVAAIIAVLDSGTVSAVYCAVNVSIPVIRTVANNSQPNGLWRHLV